jgi:phage tail-like protein
MDSNQTRFHLLLGRNDWARCTLDGASSILDTVQPSGQSFSWDCDRSELTLGARVNLFRSVPGNQAPVISQRRGAAQDRFGNWYWISGSGDELLVNSSGTSVTTHFWASADELGRDCGAGAFGAVEPAAPLLPLAFSGLAVTESHYLVVGVLEPAGFLVFDLFHGGPPRQFVWPAGIGFVPFDMAPATGGGVWILDRKNHRLWALDRTFAVVRQDQTSIDITPGPAEVFAPADGSPPPAHPHRLFPAGISIEMGSPLGSIDAIAIEALPDGSVLLLESSPALQFSTVYRFHYGQMLGNKVSLNSVLNVLDAADRAGFTLLGFDFTMIPLEQTPNGLRQNILYVVAGNGDQAWTFDAGYGGDQLTLDPRKEFYPMRLYGGRGIIRGTTAASQATQVYYDSQDRWVPLVQQSRPRYEDESTLFTRVLDGREPDCSWHKIVLDAAIPPDTALTIFSRAHNDPAHLEVQLWVEEPSPYRRGDGTELPWTVTSACLNTWELAFQRASGQYLQLKMVLSGSGRLTPRLRAMRVYYPRFSYLERYLPAVYREDQRSTSFLDRFLANIEGFYTSIEDRVSTVQALLDARSAPGEALEWLANWFGVALDPSWSEDRRRLFLRHATDFFEARGTVPGMMMALRLALEDCADEGVFTSPLGLPVGKAASKQVRVLAHTGPRIVEKFSGRRLPLAMLQDAKTDSGLPVKLKTGAWTPAQGADDLDQRWASLNLKNGKQYPISMSTNAGLYPQWRDFSTRVIGFEPAAPPPGSDLWTVFLRSRYGTLIALNTVWRASYSGFADVPFPSVLPRQPGPLLDWYQFQGALLVQAAAHQFTVFLPMPVGDAQNTEAHRAKLDLAQRVVALEKPAHTTFDIQFYWAFFRVGEARLGSDSVLDQGSRAPQLLRPVVLGDSYAGSGYLSRQQLCQPRQRPFFQQRSC